MRKYLQLFSLVTAFAAAILFIKVALMGETVKADQIGLGEGTAEYLPKTKDGPIHIDSLHRFVDMENGVRKNNGKETILWLGNSQLHGVNQYKQGDKNSLEYLHDSLLTKNMFLFGYSLPNANLQEHYALLVYISSRIEVKQLVMPVFFDDTRESDIREELVNESFKKAISPFIDSTVFGKVLEKTYAASKVFKDENADMKALHATTQESSERFLNDKLSEHSKIWAHRADVRTALIYGYLFRLRNSLLGINPNTKRKRINARYDINMEAFDKICKFCSSKGIKLVVYIPPIRDDAEQPYVEKEYLDFKNDLIKKQALYKFELYNLEKVVPAKYWGMKGTTTFGDETLEIDFMHFQNEGHKLLADTLYKRIK